MIVTYSLNFLVFSQIKAPVKILRKIYDFTYISALYFSDEDISVSTVGEVKITKIDQTKKLTEIYYTAEMELVPNDSQLTEAEIKAKIKYINDFLPKNRKVSVWFNSGDLEHDFKIMKYKIKEMALDDPKIVSTKALFITKKISKELKKLNLTPEVIKKLSVDGIIELQAILTEESKQQYESLSAEIIKEQTLVEISKNALKSKKSKFKSIEKERDSNRKRLEKNNKNLRDDLDTRETKKIVEGLLEKIEELDGGMGDLEKEIKGIEREIDLANARLKTKQKKKKAIDKLTKGEKKKEKKKKKKAESKLAIIEQEGKKAILVKGGKYKTQTFIVERKDQ